MDCHSDSRPTEASANSSARVSKYDNQNQIAFEMRSYYDFVATN